MHGFNLLNQKIYVPQTMLHLTGYIKHYIIFPKGMFLAKNTPDLTQTRTHFTANSINTRACAIGAIGP